MGQITLPEGAAPVAPSAGYVALYVKTDQRYYYKTPAGVEYALVSGAGMEALSNKTITASTVDSTPIGQSVAAAGKFTTLTLMTDLAVADGGTGRSTSTTAYGLIAAGTTATGAQQTLAAGLTTQMLVGGGAAALPVWTAATGSGAPVRANSPTLVTPVLGVATATSLQAIVGNVTPMAGSFTTLSASGALTTNSIKEDAAGNVGIGVTPSEWAAPQKAIDFVGGAAISYNSSAPQLLLNTNALFNGSAWVYKTTGPAAQITTNPGAGIPFAVNSAPSGTAGQPITFKQDMALVNGTLLVGATSGSIHTLNKGVSENSDVLTSGNGTINSFTVRAVSGTGVNTTGTAVLLNKNSTTSRSINAAGTINASGADYSEYERNNGLTIAKGAVVGFKADGTLTLTYADAIRFGIKSTNPSYVGGDTWGSEDQVGKRPEQPCYVAPIYDGAPNPGDKPVEPVFALQPAPSQQEGETDETFAIRTAQWQESCAAATAAHQASLTSYAETLAAWDAAYAAWQTDDASYQGKVIAAKAAHEAAMTQYATDLADFEVRLEAARQQVDRVAYSGKVPVNVLGATPGGYIVASYDDDGMIVGAFKHKTDLSFDAYLRAVGRVNRILEDGLAEVAVMVH